MTDNIVDFQSSKEPHVLKRKEAKVDALRDAFKAARAEATPSKTVTSLKKRKKPKKK